MNDAPPSPEPAAPRRPPAWSWRRALLHAAVVFGGVALVGLLLVLAGLVEAPERFGEGLGRFALLGGALAFAVSYLGQTGRRHAAWWLGGGATLLVAGIAAAIALHLLGPASERLTVADRAPLELVVRDDTRMLVHPTLGFAVLHPGPSYELAPEVAAAFAGTGADGSLHAWGYLDRATGEALALLLARGVDTEEEVEGFVRGVREALGRAGATIEREEIGWDRGRREVRLAILHPNGMRLTVRGLGARLGPAEAPYLVAAMATTNDPQRAERLVESLSLW